MILRIQERDEREGKPHIHPEYKNIDWKNLVQVSDSNLYTQASANNETEKYRLLKDSYFQCRDKVDTKVGSFPVLKRIVSK